MKQDIHPTYHTDVKVTCACGNTFVTGSTLESIQVEICAACHPFFTGKSKLLDTAGRVDKFKARMERAKQHQATEPKATAEPVKQNEQPVVEEPSAAATEVAQAAEQTEETTNEE